MARMKTYDQRFMWEVILQAYHTAKGEINEFVRRHNSRYGKELDDIPRAIVKACEEKVKAGRRFHQFCYECRRSYRPKSARPQKYCSYECAHRAAGRAWHRRQRAK